MRRSSGSGPSSSGRCTWRCPAGSITAVLGPNGSGKTTLIRALLGLLPLVSGEMFIGGYRPANRDSHRDPGMTPRDEGSAVVDVVLVSVLVVVLFLVVAQVGLALHVRNVLVAAAEGARYAANADRRPAGWWPTGSAPGRPTGCASRSPRHRMPAVDR